MNVLTSHFLCSPSEILIICISNLLILSSKSLKVSSIFSITFSLCVSSVLFHHRPYSNSLIFCWVVYYLLFTLFTGLLSTLFSFLKVLFCSFSNLLNSFWKSFSLLVFITSCHSKRNYFYFIFDHSNIWNPWISKSIAYFCWLSFVVAYFLVYLVSFVSYFFDLNLLFSTGLNKECFPPKRIASARNQGPAIIL